MCFRCVGASICDMHQKTQKHRLENVKTTRGPKPFALCDSLAPVRSKHDLLQIFDATPYGYMYIYIYILVSPRTLCGFSTPQTYVHRTISNICSWPKCDTIAFKHDRKLRTCLGHGSNTSSIRSHEHMFSDIPEHGFCTWHRHDSRR